MLELMAVEECGRLLHMEAEKKLRTLEKNPDGFTLSRLLYWSAFTSSVFISKRLNAGDGAFNT